MQPLLSFLPVILMSAGAVVCAMLVSSVKLQLKKLRLEVRELEAAIDQSKATEKIRAEKQSITEDTVPSLPIEKKEITSLPLEPVVYTSGTTGLNSATRTKVLKMHRLGQTAEQIAANLSLPRGEVELLLKVHQIAMKSFAGTPATA